MHPKKAECPIQEVKYMEFGLENMSFNRKNEVLIYQCGDDNIDLFNLANEILTGGGEVYCFDRKDDDEQRENEENVEI